MKKLLYLLTALLICSCSSTNVTQESRYSEIRNKEKIDSEYLKTYGKELTLDEALQIGVKRNLQLKTKEIEQEIAKLDKKIAFGNFLPKVSLTYSKTMLNSKVKAQALDTGLENILPSLGPIGGLFPSTLEARVLDKDFSMLGVNVSLPIFVPATWFLYSAREKGENISLLTKDLTEKMIKLQIIGEYYYILALESEREYLLKEVQYTEKLRQNSKLALSTESILPWEAKSIETFHEMKKHNLNMNERDLEQAKINLLNTLDLYPFLEIKLVKPIEETEADFDLDEVIYQSILNSELISIRDEAIGISNDIKKITISNFLPKIVLSAGYINTDVEVLTDTDFFMGTLGGLFTIFNGFQNINEYKKAREQQKIYYIQREQELLKVVYEAVNAYNQFNNSKEEKEIAKKNLEAMEGMLQQKIIERETGIIDDWEYLKSISEYEKALSLKEKTEYKYQLSVALLNMLMEKSIFIKGEKNENK